MPDKTLVVLEADDKFVKALHLYFRGSDYELRPHTDPSEALEASRSNPPTAVLLSLLPDDPSAADYVREFTSSVRRPVIVMSPKKNESELIMGGVAAVGAAAYIKKPFIKKAILELLGNTLSSWTPPAAEEDEGIALDVEEEPAQAKAGAGGVDFGEIIDAVDQSMDSLFPGEQGSGEAGPEQEVGFDLQVQEEASAPKQAPAPEHLAAVPSDSEKGEIEFLRGRVRELENELRERAEESKTAVRDKERIERELGGKESQHLDKIRALEKQVEDYEEDVKKRKQLVSQLSESIKSLNEEIEEKDRKVREEASHFEGQTAQLQDKLRSLTEDLDRTTHNVEDGKEEGARLNRRIEEMQHELNGLNEKLRATTEERNAAEARIEDVEGRLKQTKEELDQTTTTLESTRTDLEQTRTDMEQTRGKLENAESRINTAREAFEKGLGALTPP